MSEADARGAAQGGGAPAGGRDAAEQRRHLGARLREAEDVVDEEQRIGPGLIAEILGHGERRPRHAPAGAGLGVARSALTMAEYFRDQGQDVLLFIDNIFRFVQAGSEASALLGRLPRAAG